MAHPLAKLTEDPAASRCRPKNKGVAKRETPDRRCFFRRFPKKSSAPPPVADGRPRLLRSFRAHACARERRTGKGGNVHLWITIIFDGAHTEGVATLGASVAQSRRPRGAPFDVARDED